MKNIGDSYINEFVALSKCLPTMLELYEESSDPKHAEARSELGASMLTRMQQLLDSEDAPVGWSEQVRRDVKATNDALVDTPPTSMPKPYGTTIDGERVLTKDDELEGERQLVAARLLIVIQEQLDNLGPNAHNIMVDQLANGTTQAYIVPETLDATADTKLNMFRFELQLQAV
ncbi:hypothetical protein LCGC14_0921620 [marine sediment metagenome]|uniref:Uncharacterized protein n=1 Tax=marine sediment metagenome TaxID=412755 RepID=A0A0F9NQN6_9ZZZZ